MQRACVRACRRRGRAEGELAGRQAGCGDGAAKRRSATLVSLRPPFPTITTPSHSPVAVVPHFVSLFGALQP